MKNRTAFIRDAFIGFAVGDALGVPVEFDTREKLRSDPVKGMLGGIRHNQPAGTWSDDSSMVFCTAESLCNGYNLDDIAIQFSNWKNNKFWTPHGRVFDIGIATGKGIERIDRFLEMGIHVKPISSHSVNQNENGNGSLMRMLPFVFFLQDKPVRERFEIISQVSALTHAHIRSIIGCFIYVEFGIHLIKGEDKTDAYSLIQKEIPQFLNNLTDPGELGLYNRILQKNIAEDPEESIRSSQYVLHSLEACIWTVMRNTNFHDTVLQAVNLGEDTDTIAALTGGLAGLIYDTEQIPEAWVNALARKADILSLADRFSKSLVL
jgi:ADP-ribosyl-[dinitrogen reductase] hydrolase